MSSQINPLLSPNTQAVLLLCGSLGQPRTQEYNPLNLKEYNGLAQRLRSQQMTPGDLLTREGEQHLSELVADLDKQRVLALLKRGVLLSLALENWTNQGIWILSRSDANYPQQLKQNLQHRCPPVLYGVGEVSHLSQGGVAIVGSRHVNEEELDYTNYLALTCAKENLAVISGGAKGIDEQAMRSCLEAGGVSIGVLANSLTKAALSRHYRQSLYDKKLVMISPYDPDAGFAIGTAMGRNKNIYALADYAVVIHSDLDKGGTWSGATEALKTIPRLPIFVRYEEPVPQGNLGLKQQGALALPTPPWLPSLREALMRETLIASEAEGMGRTESLEKRAAKPSDELQVAASQASLDNSELSHLEGLAEPSPQQEIYQAVLPVLLKHLQEPVEAKTLAESLNVQKGQMQAWLKQAVQDDKVTKLKKPVRYIVNQDS
ncbi:MAG: DNA-protecting protein DprA [Phormidium sp. PBR-2020]|nr:MAG: DNA-protecting protein DprA [Phormidium sp. PBR-2020]